MAAADPQRTTVAVDHGGDRELDSRTENAFEVAGDHIGQLAQNIPHIVGDRGRRRQAEEAAGEVARLLWKAMDQNGALPGAGQVDRRRHEARRHGAGGPCFLDLDAHHGREHGLDNLLHVSLLQTDGRIRRHGILLSKRYISDGVSDGLPAETAADGSP